VHSVSQQGAVSLGSIHQDYRKGLRNAATTENKDHSQIFGAASSATTVLVVTINVLER
jgi:hypothetical protein